jgi:hypothetical protein
MIILLITIVTTGGKNMKQLTKLATALPTGFLSSFLLTTFVVTAFIVTLLLTTHFGSVVTAQEAPQEQAQGEERIAFTMRHTTSWFGDTADAGAGAWVQGTINAMWVDEDGTVYTNSIWDEDAREAGVYRDGQVVGRLPGLHGTGGYAVTGDDAHIYVAATPCGALTSPTTAPAPLKGARDPPATASS